MAQWGSQKRCCIGGRVFVDRLAAVNVADMKWFGASTSISRYLYVDDHSAQYVHEAELENVSVSGEEVGSFMFLGTGDGVRGARPE